MKQGWSLKALHRLILNSAVWQQAVVEDAALVDEGLLRGFSRR
jgi:hypothetical protein